jgi:putative RNA 2'-phosphotransferase
VNSAKEDKAETQRLRRVSKFLSLVLRHDPAAGNVDLDAEGWVDIEELLSGMAQAGTRVSAEELDTIVATDNKGRYTIQETKIRANQGHSIDVDLGLSPKTPPPVLFHGTAQRFLDSIMATGLNAGDRQHVHLSADRETALTVGRRHGAPAVLVVDARRLHDDGQTFLRSENGVWLTSPIPSSYLRLDDGSASRSAAEPKGVELQVYADYYQFYVQDVESTCDTSVIWDDPASTENGVVVGDGLIAVSTKRYETVPVRVEWYHADPGFMWEGIDRVSECGIVVTTTLGVGMPISISPLNHIEFITPGTYDVRVMAWGFNTVVSDFDGGDHYIVQLWPAQELRALTHLAKPLAETN